MKKLILLFLGLSFAFITTSCHKDDEFSAKANITVIEAGIPKSGITVCMFADYIGPGSGLFTPLGSKRKSVTESNGVATFELKENFDLELIDNQTTLYFAVFSNNDLLLGQTALTIKKGETKSATISY